ncbi:uncharacterized protein [Nicotiana tomentosiformis]|uniref:uncharacterized protein n=1 Tax=Nicotiana tomentosiformis TaxID=4098 RepID=UPI00388C6DF3
MGVLNVPRHYSTEDSLDTYWAPLWCAYFTLLHIFVQIQHVVPVQPVVRAAASEEEQLRLARFKKYDPPTFSGLASESAHGFLEECHRILHTMGIVKTSGVAFTTFQLRGAAYHWWRAYELGSPAESAPLTWVHFSEMFLRKFVPQSLRDTWRTEFEQLCQGTMSVLEYAMRFSDLVRHAPALVSTVRERVRRFIEGLRRDIRFSMARELESDISFQQVVGIARRVEGIWDQEREDRRGHEEEYIRGPEREDREVRRPRRPERSIGPYFGGRRCGGLKWVPTDIRLITGAGFDYGQLL